jgi:hypothetical protein
MPLFEERITPSCFNVGEQTLRVKSGTMSEPAEEVIVHNLIDALERLRDDLDKVELWAAALGHFQHGVPDYEPGSAYMLSASSAPEPPATRP